MRELQQRLREIEAPPPRISVEDVQDLVLKRARSRRMIRFGLVAAAALVAVAVGVLLVRQTQDSGTTVTATAGSATSDDLGFADSDAQSPVEPGEYLTLEWIDATATAEGTDVVTLLFDADLPDVPVHFIDDIEAPQPRGISYTTQDSSVRAMTVCGNLHMFPEGSNRSVDIFLPANWFQPDTESYLGTLRAKQGLAKILTCEPRAGLVQIAIWGAASARPDDVAVSLAGNAIIVQIHPSPPQAQSHT